MKLLSILIVMSLSALSCAQTVQSTQPIPTPQIMKEKPQASPSKVKSSTPKTSVDSKKKPEAKSPAPKKKTKIVRKILNEAQKKELQDWLAAKVKKGDMSQKQADEASKYGELGVYDVMKSETARKKK